jgi:hypothetical protein
MWGYLEMWESRYSRDFTEQEQAIFHYVANRLGQFLSAMPYMPNAPYNDGTLGLSGKPVDVWFDVGALNPDDLYFSISTCWKIYAMPTFTLRFG